MRHAAPRPHVRTRNRFRKKVRPRIFSEALYSLYLRPSAEFGDCCRSHHYCQSQRLGSGVVNYLFLWIAVKHR